MDQEHNEDRADYLIRVLHEFMQLTIAGEQSIAYDGAECSGDCIADYIESEMLHMKQQRDELLAALKEINNIALGHPYAGVTCGEVARVAIVKAEAA